MSSGLIKTAPEEILRGCFIYLPDSVLEFPSREEFKGLMAAAGFRDLALYDLTFGIAIVYVGEK